MAIAVTLVVLDLSDSSVHRYWSRHSFTSSVLSGLLVLLLTVLIVDRVARARQLRGESRAIAAQAVVILAQALRAAHAIARTAPAEGNREDAAAELRIYTQMLVTSTPVLIGADSPRSFLETAQRVGVQLLRGLRDQSGQAQEVQVNAALRHLRDAAAPTSVRAHSRAAHGSEFSIGVSDRGRLLGNTDS